MREKLRSVWKKIACGIAIGVGFVLPGVSGGVLAVSMGLFEPMVEAIKNLLKQFKESFRFLFPIGVGGVIGVLLTSSVLKVVIESYEAEMLSLFIGFMLGSIPVLWAETLTERHPGFRWKDLLFMLAGFAFTMTLMTLDNSKAATVAESVGRALPIPLALQAGAVMAVGIIVPGLSCSFLLEFLGLYKSVVIAIADIYIPTLFFMGVGFILPAIFMIVLISFLFKRYRAPSYTTIIGISVGSMALIVPSVLKGFSWWCVPLLIAGLAAGLWQSRRELKSGKGDKGLDFGEMVGSLRDKKKDQNA
ncbi:MAG: DUF368 domain-containing protein [Clostridia bacterium]|nr:DUF368 domain-containing protein [Clostridia bacterium]